MASIIKSYDEYRNQVKQECQTYLSCWECPYKKPFDTECISRGIYAYIEKDLLAIEDDLK